LNLATTAQEPFPSVMPVLGIIQALALEAALGAQEVALT